MSAGEKFERLVRIMHTLRRECPWDRSQNHDTLRPYLLEETHEALDALDRKQYDELCEELGDLLLQIVFHAEVAEEGANFDIEDVIEGIIEKLIRRHPHVFADAEAQTPAEALRRWESIKTGEERRESVLDGLPAGLPALLRAERLLEKVRHTGVDPAPSDKAEGTARRWLEVLAGADGSDPEGAEAATGLLCLAIVALAREKGASAEDALRKLLGGLDRDFRRAESAARKQGRDLSGLVDEWLDDDTAAP